MVGQAPQVGVEVGSVGIIRQRMLTDIQEARRGVTKRERARIARILNAGDHARSIDDGIEVRKTLADASRQQAYRQHVLGVVTRIDVHESQIALGQQPDEPSPG